MSEGQHHEVNIYKKTENAVWPLGARLLGKQPPEPDSTSLFVCLSPPFLPQRPS